MRICLVGTGNLLGFEDVYQDRYYTTSIRCYSDKGILLKFESNAFLTVMKKDKEVYNEFGDL